MSELMAKVVASALALSLYLFLLLFLLASSFQDRDGVGDLDGEDLSWSEKTCTVIEEKKGGEREEKTSTAAGHRGKREREREPGRKSTSPVFDLTLCLSKC